MSEEQCAMVQAITLLRKGQPLIFPTDTVYGLGVAVGYAQSPQVLYRLKQREDDKPVAWLVDGVHALEEYGEEVPAYAHGLAQKFWPGPLTLVIKAGKKVPRAFCSREGTIALRMPDDEQALALIKGVGVPLAATSANISGQQPVQVEGDLAPSLIEAVPLVVGDARKRSGIASTVADCTGVRPIILREGGVSQTDINAIY